MVFQIAVVGHNELVRCGQNGRVLFLRYVYVLLVSAHNLRSTAAGMPVELVVDREALPLVGVLVNILGAVILADVESVVADFVVGKCSSLAIVL